jgi:hypothetical protein
MTTFTLAGKEVTKEQALVIIETCLRIHCKNPSGNPADLKAIRELNGFRKLLKGVDYYA